MTPDELAALHPVLYHVGPPEARGLIETHGLLSPLALCGLLGFDDARTEAVLTTLRRSTTPLGAGVALNDNSPISLKRLGDCLEPGLTPEAWLRELNSRVFLFPTRQGADNFVAARANAARARDVWSFDTARFASAFLDRLEITPFNTGATLRTTPRRGLLTFAPLEGLYYAEWRSRRREAGHKKGLDSIKEVCIRHSAPGAAGFALGVERIPPASTSPVCRSPASRPATTPG